MTKTLFKYTKAEYIDSVLKDGGRLKITNPSLFNDPNDCFFGISENNLRKTHRMLMNVAFICEFKDDQIFNNEFKSFHYLYEITKKSTCISHVYTENPAINAIVKKYLKKRTALADYLERQKLQQNNVFDKVIEDTIRRSLIASLTKDNLNFLMWSHYADGHQGICVEYEFDDEKKLLDVIYSDDQNSFDLYEALRYIIPSMYFGDSSTNETNPKFNSICNLPFLRKTKKWEYENEVRMIFDIENDKEIICSDGIWFYPKAKVKSVYIGCRTDEKTKQKIEEVCKNANIPVHHLSLKKGTNKLFIED